MVNLDDMKSISSTAPSSIGSHRQDWQLLSLLEYIDDTSNVFKRRKATETNIRSFQLFQCFKQAAFEYYSAVHLLVGKFPTLKAGYELASALRKINREWLELAALVQTSSLATYKEVRLLEVLVEGVLDTLPRDSTPEDDVYTLRRDHHILPIFGSTFEVRHFAFAPQIKVLAMPTYTLYTPWRWSVIWHEIAGLIMRQGDVQDLIEPLMAKSKEVEEDWWQNWVADGEYYGQRQDTSSSGLQVKLVYTEPDQRSWIKELLEDAFSVLALGKPTLQILHEVLCEYYTDLTKPDDERHPAPAVRLELAYQLLKLMGEPVDDEVADLIRDAYKDLPQIFDNETIQRIAAAIYESRAQLINQNTVATTENRGPAAAARESFLAAFEAFNKEDLLAASADEKSIEALLQRVYAKARAPFADRFDRDDDDDKADPSDKRWELDEAVIKEYLQQWHEAIAKAVKTADEQEPLTALKALHFVEVDALAASESVAHRHPSSNEFPFPQEDMRIATTVKIAVGGGIDPNNGILHALRTANIYMHSHNRDAVNNRWSGFIG